MWSDEPSEYKCECPWNNRAWRNTKDCQYEYCMQCNNIKSFHWKSLWRRIKCVFINETLEKYKKYET